MLGGLLVACGDGSAQPPASGSPAVTTKTAKDLLPDLAAQGFAIAEQGKDPAAAANQDVYRGIYQRNSSTAGSGQAQVVLYRLPDVNAAKTEFTTLADALRNPPPSYFGGGGASATQVDTASPPVGDERRGYVTSKPDGKGKLLWTDVYRFANVVTVVQVVEAGSVDQTPLRRAIAEQIVGRMK